MQEDFDFEYDNLSFAYATFFSREMLFDFVRIVWKDLI